MPLNGTGTALYFDLGTVRDAGDYRICLCLAGGHGRTWLAAEFRGSRKFLAQGQAQSFKNPSALAHWI